MHRSGVGLIIEVRLPIMHEIVMDTAHSQNLAPIVDMQTLD